VRVCIWAVSFGGGAYKFFGVTSLYNTDEQYVITLRTLPNCLSSWLSRSYAVEQGQGSVLGHWFITIRESTNIPIAIMIPQDTN